MSAPRNCYRLNVQAAIILGASGLAAALALYVLWGYREKQVLGKAIVKVKAFREEGDKEKDPNLRARKYDLARRHLSQYLVARSEDPDGLEIQADLLNLTGDSLGAAFVFEHLLRINPNGPRAQKARRRLAEVYIQYSENVRANFTTQLMPDDNTTKDLRYHAAELLATQLLQPDATPRVDDAEAHRLRALALEGQLITGKMLRVNPNAKSAKDPQMVEVDLLEETIKEYQAALQRDPGDLTSARRLIRLYYTRKQDTKAALQVLDTLKSHRDSVEVRLTRYSFFKEIGDNQAAAIEMEAAYKLAPEDLLVILTAAKDALQAGKGPAEARRWLDLVPPRSRDEPSVYLLSGYVAHAEKHLPEAMEIWRKGLEKSGGTDPDLTWQLAYTLLELNRDAEAGKLVEQFSRLVKSDDYRLRFLEALQDEHAGRARALERLEWVRDNSSGNIQVLVRLALGRCQEKQGERDEAEKTYRAGIQIDPKSVLMRLALSRLLLAPIEGKMTRLEEAEKETLQGLQAIPDDPALLVVLAEARLRVQLSRPSERRNWSDFDEAYGRAATVAPNNPALALMHAERLTTNAGLDQAIDFLKKSATTAPNNPELAIAYAEGLIKQGKPDEALAVLEHASAPGAAGDRASLRIDRARILTALGRGREARQVLIRDVNRLPQSERAEVWRILLLLCNAQGDRNTNHQAFEEWIQLLPDDPQPKLAMLELEFETNDEAAIKKRLDSLRPPEGEDDLVYRLARARERIWKQSLPNTTPKARLALLQEADAIVESVVRDTKINPIALLYKGQILEEEKDLGRAADYYSRSWTRGNPAALPRLVDLWVRLERWDDLAKLVQTNPSYQVDQIEAWSLIRHGHKDQALKIVEQSVRERAGTQAWHVVILNFLGQNQKVEELFKKIAEKQPEQLEPWLTLLRFQMAQGNTEAAKATFARAKQLVKSNRPELVEAQCRLAMADLPGANKAMEDALNRYPGDLEVKRSAAGFFQATGHPERTEQCLRQILALAPNDRTTARQLAIILAGQSGTWQEALSLLGPEESATSPEERLARAVVLARGPDPVQRKRATDLLSALMKDLPAENSVAIAARDVLAKLLYAAGQSLEASQIAAVTARSDSNPATIAFYAETLIQAEQFDAAEAQLDRLAQLDPQSAFDARLRARLIGVRHRKQPDEALSALEKDYLVRGNSPGAEEFGREAYRMALATGGSQAAGLAERVGRSLAKKKPELSWMPAVVLAAQGKRGEALALCLSAVQAKGSPDDRLEAGRVALSIAVAAVGDSSIVQKADEVLAEGIRRGPAEDTLAVMKAMINHLQKHFDEEIRLYRTILVRQPQNPVVLNNLAWALSEGMHQPSEALERIDELIKLVGRNPEPLDTRGVILVRLERYDEAIKDLEEAVKGAPTGTHFYHLAQAYQKAGRVADYQKARDQARQAGLTAEMVDPAERPDFEAMMNH